MSNLYEAYYNILQRGGKINEKVNKMTGDRGASPIIDPGYEPRGSQNTIMTPEQRAMTEAQILQSIEAQKAAPSHEEQMKAAAAIDAERQKKAQEAYQLYLQEQARQQANQPKNTGIYSKLFGG